MPNLPRPVFRVGLFFVRSRELSAADKALARCGMVVSGALPENESVVTAVSSVC